MLVFGEFTIGFGHVAVGGAIPIHTGVVACVVAWPLGFALMPFFHERNAADHGVVNIALVHGANKFWQRFAFLEKIDYMDVGITVIVVIRAWLLW